MNSLLALAQQYNRKADRVVKRHTNEEGAFDQRFQPTVDYYRNAAGAVSRLAEGLEDATETTWNLEGERRTAVGFSRKHKEEEAPTSA